MAGATRAALYAATGVAVVVVLLTIYIYAAHAEAAVAAAAPSPCASKRMPALADGVTCQAGGGQKKFAWLTTQKPNVAGIGPPSGALLHTRVASDGSCVSEQACQALCLNDSACRFYTYDLSARVASPNCSEAGAVCKTHAGPLPATVDLGQYKFVTGGIPASAL